MRLTYVECHLPTTTCVSFGIMDKSVDDRAEILMWIKENCSRHAAQENCIYFKDSDDALAFKLRWL